ncbi:hypothetical protein H8959_021903 [Pygathrix nigripes]
MATPAKWWAVEAMRERVLRHKTFISDVLQRDLRKLTLAEALKFIDRESSLLTELSNSLTKDSMNVKAHIPCC